MDKLIAYLLIVLGTLGCAYCQESSSVKYEINVLEKKNAIPKNNGENAYQNVVNLAGRAFNGSTAILKINKKSSFYEINDNLSSDNVGDVYGNLAKTLYKTDQKYYYNNDIKELLIQLKSYGKTLVVKYDSIPYNWKISSEQKIILGYNCFKATTTKRVQNSKGDFKFPVVVWFTPEISFQTGPEDYIGLPGLVLKATYHSSTPYDIEAIQINNEQNITINKPKRGKIVSFEEYELLNKKQSANFKKYIDN